MMKKVVLLAFVLVLLSTVIIGARLVITASGSTTRHVYSGESIQDAINLAQSGDTIIVHNGTYYEHVVVNKTVSLIGENKHNTIIDGNGTGAVIYVMADNANISDFTAQGSGYGLFDAGIFIYSSIGNNISYNIVAEGKRGIGLHYSRNSIVANNVGLNNSWAVSIVSDYDSGYNTVIGNNVSNNNIGILISHSNNNTLTGNIASNNSVGILLQDGNNNTITDNYVSNNSEYGIALQNFGHRIDDNIIINNTISFNNYGIYITDGENNTIHHNNFIDNINQTVVERGYWAEYFDILVTNIWDDGALGNYWSDYLDRYPNATEIDGSGIWDHPYVIDENNQDNYPIIPEFPTWTSMLLMLIVLTVVIAVSKRRLPKNSIPIKVPE